jgi:hypothetical protein
MEQVARSQLTEKDKYENRSLYSLRIYFAQRKYPEKPLNLVRIGVVSCRIENIDITWIVLGIREYNRPLVVLK